MALDVKALLKRRDNLHSEKGSWEAMWDEITTYIAPRAQRFQSKGAKRRATLFTDEAEKANGQLAASLGAMLSNEALDWCGVRTVDEALQSAPGIERMLEARVKVMLNEWKNSNLYTALDEDYLDLGSLCTCILFLDDDFTFRAIPPFECDIAESKNGVVDTLFRTYKMTGRQCVESFGKENMSKQFQDEYEKKMDEDFDIVHIVMPRRDAPKMANSSKDYPIASYYIEEKTKRLIEESGYKEMPFFVCRWRKSSGEVWGRGPGTQALPDAKSLNSFAGSNMGAAKKMVDPPTIEGEDAVAGKLNVAPRGRNKVTAGTQPHEYPQILNDITSLPMSVEMEEKIIARIRETFYTNKLQLIEADRMTATEVQQRVEENMRILGPTFGRVQRELLKPLVERSYLILERRGDFDAFPLPQTGLKVEYESPLERAQKSHDVNAIRAALELLVPVLEVLPETRHIIKAYPLAKDILAKAGVPKNIIADEKEYQMAVQAERQQQAQAQAMAQAEQASKVGKNVGQTDVENVQSVMEAVNG